jgi:hypothetical protein
MASERVESNNMAMASASSDKPARRMNQAIFKNIFRQAVEMEHPRTPELMNGAHKALMAYTAARTPKEIKTEYNKLYEFIRQRPDRSILNKRGQTGILPLQYAVIFGKTEAIELLIRNGADVNISIHEIARDENRRPLKDREGNFILREEYAIPLKFAVELPRLEFDHISPSAAKKQKISEEERRKINREYRENNKPLQLLLEAPNIDVNKRDHLGKTALHYAAEYNFPSVLTPNIGFPSRIRMLLEHGADPTILDNARNPAIHYAMDPDVIAILQESMPHASHGGKRRTRRHKHHRRRTHRK